MQSLDKTFARYKEARTFIETQKKTKIKMFVCDGHKTFTTKEFRQLLTEDGTTQKIRAPYTPKQNPISERRVRTIFEMGRTILIQSGLPANCWEDALLHANYVRNRVIT